MEQVLLDRPITEVEWEALCDPVGGRYEVLDGRLVVTPSAGADHGRFGEDLADILRRAVRLNGLDLPVTADIEWRSVAADVVTQAPRGDVVVGRSLHPEKRVHDSVPLLVAEVWSPLTRPGVRAERRGYWQRLEVRHYWEVLLTSDVREATVVVWDLDSEAPPVVVAGGESLALTVPFTITITPSLIHGWASAESERADRETARADRAERDLAEATAEAARVAADAERLRRQLRDLGGE